MVIEEPPECPKCGGDGTVGGESCPDCEGFGYIEDDDEEAEDE